MDIFIINTGNVNNVSDELLKKFKYKEFTDIKKSDEHCLAYLMLDKILNEVYKIKNRTIKFFNNKPFLTDRAKYFSISHSNEYIAIAISDYNCGIDIEKIKKRDYISISKRMNFSSKTLEEFYKDWTLYESKYKLGEEYKNLYQTQFKNYIITALSSNNDECFEIYIQNGTNFSKL